jgi:TP901 family phage tail tape measure protein
VIGGQLRGAATTFGVVAASAMLPVRSAVAFENAMLGVAKQVEGARDASGNLTPIYSAIRKEIFGMAREVPVVTTELAGMAAAGARMGVARNELMGFVRTSAMMADAFEMPSAQLADDMGKIAGLFRIPIPKIGELADAINYLDDNTRSTGGGIIDVMRRIGGMAATIKMPAREAAALGSTFLSLGSSAEVAGTASNAVMRILGAATVQSKRVREGLSSIGFNPADVQSSMSKDSTGTILRLLDKLNTLSSEQRMVAATSIFGAEYGDDIAKLSTGTAAASKQTAACRASSTHD